VPTILYTMVGGVQAVTWTDVKQMGVVVGAMLAAVIVLVAGLPHGVGAGDALHLAGALGKLKAIDLHFDVREKYTIWSGLIGGLFLSLSYFGCDQSQVQRYLTAKSVDQSRHSLLMSGFVKIPLQALILLTGVLMFVFFLFNKGPMLFNRAPLESVQTGPRAAEYQALDEEYGRAFETRKSAAQALAGATDNTDAKAAFTKADADVRAVRQRATTLVREATNTQYADVNFVFPSFVVTYMPIGFVGLIIAAIFAAAMSSIAAELNALATATVIDVYKRHVKPTGEDSHYLMVSKWATGLWGFFVCVMAIYAVQLVMSFFSSHR